MPDTVQRMLSLTAGRKGGAAWPEPIPTVRASAEVHVAEEHSAQKRRGSFPMRTGAGVEELERCHSPVKGQSGVSGEYDRVDYGVIKGRVCTTAACRIRSKLLYIDSY